MKLCILEILEESFEEKVAEERHSKGPQNQARDSDSVDYFQVPACVALLLQVVIQTPCVLNLGTVNRLGQVLDYSGVEQEPDNGNGRDNAVKFILPSHLTSSDQPEENRSNYNYQR